MDIFFLQTDYLNTASMNIHVQLCALVPVSNSFQQAPRNGIAIGSYDNSMFNLWGNNQPFFTATTLFCITTSILWGLQFLHILTNTSCSLLHHNTHSSRSILFLKSVIPLFSFTILLCNFLPCLFLSNFLLKGNTIRQFTASVSFLWDIILRNCILLLPTSTAL